MDKWFYCIFLHSLLPLALDGVFRNSWIVERNEILVNLNLGCKWLQDPELQDQFEFRQFGLFFLARVLYSSQSTLSFPLVTYRELAIQKEREASTSQLQYEKRSEKDFDWFCLGHMPTPGTISVARGMGFYSCLGLTHIPILFRDPVAVLGRSPKSEYSRWVVHKWASRIKDKSEATFTIKMGKGFQDDKNNEYTRN